MFDQYKGLKSSILLYLKAYGGWKGFFSSPYLSLALILTIVAAPVWLCDSPSKKPWYDIALSVMPNMLGFTLGGYAMLLAFGDNRFKDAIRGPEDDGSCSPFMVINGTFIHFIIVEIEFAPVLWTVS